MSSAAFRIRAYAGLDSRSIAKKYPRQGLPHGGFVWLHRSLSNFHVSQLAQRLNSAMGASKCDPLVEFVYQNG
jgi:hypothetical protein